MTRVFKKLKDGVVATGSGFRSINVYSKAERDEDMEKVGKALGIKENGMKCSSCSCSCGDDFKTETKYKEEKNVGDRLKNILLQIYDMSSIDNLQVAEIKALIGNLVDEHIEETDGT